MAGSPTLVASRARVAAGRLWLLAVAVAACAGPAADNTADGPPPSDTAPDAAMPDAPDARADAPDARAEAETPAPPLAYFDQCVPGAPPDAACYAARRAPESAEVALALDVARAFMARHPADTLAWNWEEGVLGHGLAELQRVSGAADIDAYLAAWLQTHIARGYRIFWSDSCPPALAALHLFAQTGEAGYATIVDDVLHYALDEAPRSPEGGLSHLGLIAPSGASLWLDTLFMVGMPLIRAGVAGREERALPDAALQLRVFAALMQRPEGFYIHAVGGVDTSRQEGVFWARGNAWVTVAGVEYLRAAALAAEPADPDARAAFDRQLAAILTAQDPATGLFWTVLNRPGETYLETSASALFGYALARAYRTGLTDVTPLGAVHAALGGVKSRIVAAADGSPLVTGTSLGTSPGGFDNYAQVAQGDDVPFGVGAVLLLLVEASGLPEP